MRLLAVVCSLGQELGAAMSGNPLHYPQPSNQPDEFFVLVEIPASGAIKYEVDVETGAPVGRSVSRRCPWLIRPTTGP